MNVQEARNQQEWDTFLSAQTYRPFLQSWTMGEVYRDTGQEPIRLEVRDQGTIVAICQAILVPAKRGRHLSIPYGPVINYQLPTTNYQLLLDSLTEELKKVAREHHCSFIRMSPFWPSRSPLSDLSPEALTKGEVRSPDSRPSPLHILAEHIWYLPLVAPDPWQPNSPLPAGERSTRRTEEQLLMSMRKTTRNLVRRAERDGVEISASKSPNTDLETFIALHEETRRRHGFTPYTDAFFRAQVKRFSERGELTLYLARYQGEVAAASIHMHAFGETSYHHGASTHRLSKVPASYLLQWTAIRDALKRGDHVYNFWGIAPTSGQRTLRLRSGQAADSGQQENAIPKSDLSPEALAKGEVRSPKSDHPFAGVTLFKTGFGGSLLPLVHCMDFPLTTRYHLTRAVELLRKWRRGF